MTLSMKADIKENWIAALESGVFEQGEGLLHQKGYGLQTMGEPSHDRYCCLGILCLMAAAEGVVEVGAESPGLAVFYDGEDAYIPQSVVQWAGLVHEGERLYTDSNLEESRGVINGSNGGFLSLAVMNDSGAPFSEIAQVIREKVIGI